MNGLFDLTGRTALVTGAARGIGRAIAAGLAEAGADVALVDRPGAGGLDESAAVVTGHGRRCLTFEHDLACVEDLAPLADQVWAAAGNIDILVNNAGVGRLERFNEITVETWRAVMSVNVEAVFFLTQRVAEHMIAAGVPGRVVNISSKNAFVAEAGLAHYNASKAAVELLTKSLAVELGPYGITANTVAPGMIDTGIADEFALDRAAFEAAYQEHIPLRGRFGAPRDCVGAVILLSSPAGAYITGQHLVVDGGVLADQMPRLRFMPPYRPSL